MTIGELAAESGLPTSTIRYWERISFRHEIGGEWEKAIYG